MSASFNKNGNIICTPIEEGNKVKIYKNDIIINENLVKGMFRCTRTNTSSEYSGAVRCILTKDQIKELSGQKLTFSYYYSIEGDRIAGTNSLGNRFGIHASINYNTTGSTQTQWYPFASYLEATGTGRAVMTWQIPILESVNTELTFSLQCRGDLYARPADENITWYIKDVKLEIGDKATPYCPSVEDGFGSSISSSSSNVIYGANFIEI